MASSSGAGELPLSYRRAEVLAVAGCLRAGDSCCLVGASGMAKSNLFRHLLNPGVRRHYFGDDWRGYHFIAVDANELGEASEMSLSALLLERLLEESRASGADERVVSSLERLRADAAAPESSSPQHLLSRAVKSFTGSGGGRLVILFDQFDRLYQSLSPKFYALLRSVRDENKYRVSYVVFTREELSRLRRSQEHEEFDELFSPNVFGLGPYDGGDSQLLLDRVSGRYGRELSQDDRERVIELTGGHPGLLKALCMALIAGGVRLPAGREVATAALLEVRDVRSECGKLWNGISRDEQNFLTSAIAGAAPSPRDAETQALLELKGLISRGEAGPRLFSPIFGDYVAAREPAAPPATKIRAGSFRIDVAGEVWVNGRQVTPPLSKKELLLLEYLCLEPGRLRTKDEIIALVYPDEYKSGESVTDDALNALVKRLRDRLEHLQGKRGGIVTVRGKGYRFDPFKKA